MIPTIASNSLGTLVEIMSQRDLFRCAPARAIGYRDEAQGIMMETLTIGEVMVCDVITIGPDGNVATAAQLMFRNKIGCQPVKESGILTEADFVKYVGEID